MEYKYLIDGKTFKNVIVMNSVKNALKKPF